jgi:hypothetical protein
VEVGVARLVAADVGEGGMAEREQVLRREPCGRVVVDLQGAHPGDRPAHTHERLAERVQARDLVLVELERDGDHGVDALAQEEVVEDGAPFRSVSLEVVERDVVARIHEPALRAREDLGEEPPIEERQNDADVAGSPAGQG